MNRCIETHRERFGVEPICRTLQVAPSSYWASAAGHLQRGGSVTKRSSWNCSRRMPNTSGCTVHASSGGNCSARKLGLRAARLSG
jgi:hypothetical protein